MDLWIRSQDKMSLELVNRVEITHKLTDGKFGILDTPVKTEECIIWVNGRNFGEYKTEQRAIEVLDEILDNMFIIWKITQPDGSFTVSKQPKVGENFVVYQMPADKGVEDD